MNNPLKGKIPPLGLKVELKAGEEYVVPSEIDGIPVWVINTQTGKVLRPPQIIRAEEKMVLRVVPVIAGG